MNRCYSCGERPAGFGTYYAHSAFCPTCQPRPDPSEPMPHGGKNWGKRIARWEAETGRVYGDG